MDRLALIVLILGLAAEAVMFIWPWWADRQEPDLHEMDLESLHRKDLEP